MYFSKSLILAFAAVAAAAPTAPNVLDTGAGEVDQVQSGLDGASDVSLSDI
jgi:hypothetical protein